VVEGRDLDGARLALDGLRLQGGVVLDLVGGTTDAGCCHSRDCAARAAGGKKEKCVARGETLSHDSDTDDRVNARLSLRVV
jgi:hypothetical protein